jgi:hypothetical protein
MLSFTKRYVCQCLHISVSDYVNPCRITPEHHRGATLIWLSRMAGVAVGGFCCVYVLIAQRINGVACTTLFAADFSMPTVR